MKLIDADKILEALGVFKDKKHGDPHFLNGIETAREIVEGMSEEVVRCKDCKYIGLPLSPDDYNACKHKRAMVYAPADGFCCWGERRSDETE